MSKKQRNQQIAQLYEAGARVEDLARSHGLSVGSVKNILSARGARRFADHPARAARMRAMKAAGFALRDIARLFKLSESRAATVLRVKRSIAPPPDGPSGVNGKAADEGSAK